LIEASDIEALWVIRKSQKAIWKGFCVALDLEIVNTIHNFEPDGVIQFVKAHAVAELGGGGQVKVSLAKMDDAIAHAGQILRTCKHYYLSTAE
jgi:hypothetical protein